MKNSSPYKTLIPGLTMIRYPLAIWVILHHTLDFNVFRSLKNAPLYLVAITETGNQATTVFFILSGFVISHSWFRTNQPKAKDFYLKRFLSLYPLYLISLIAILSSQYGLNSDKNYIYFHIFGLQPYLLESSWFTLNGPGWSLGVEFLLYLLFPIIIKPMAQIKRVKTCLAVLVIVEIIIVGALFVNGNEQFNFYLLYHFPPFQLFHFAAGILCYLVYSNPRNVLTMTKFPIIVSTALFVMAIYFSHISSISVLKYGVVMVAPSILLILSIALNDKSHSVSPPSFFRKTLVQAGEATFVLYITHWAWVGVLRKLLAFQSNEALMYLSLTCLLTVFTIIAFLVQKNAVLVIGDWKNRAGERRKAFFIFIILFMGLTISDQNFPRQWTSSTLDWHNSNEIQILGSSRDPESEEVTLETKISNLGDEVWELKNCFILMHNPHLLSQQQKNPILIEMSGRLLPNNSTITELKFVFPFTKADRLRDFDFSGVCY
jgi:peptidoglycan/LPS O-acetylase OafA/YrhL